MPIIPLPRRAGERYDGGMLFVVHALDKEDILPIRAKHYRAHRIHLDRAEEHAVDVVTAGTLVADDGETPVGNANRGLSRVRRAATISPPRICWWADPSNHGQTAGAADRGARGRRVREYHSGSVSARPQRQRAR